MVDSEITRRTAILAPFAVLALGKLNQMQGVSAVLNVMTLPPGATKTQARIVVDGVRGAIFEYAAGGPVGALVSSWARTAGTDPYGNTYPQGFNAGSGSSFSGTDFVIDSSGIFVYSGTPALGNLIVSVTTVAGTDGFGNIYAKGVNSYVPITGNDYAVGLNQTGGGTGMPGMSVQSVNNPPNSPPGVFALGSITHATAILTSGSETNLDANAHVDVQSSLASGIAGGFVYLSGGTVAIGASETIEVDDNKGQMNFAPPIGGAPSAVGGSASLYASANANMQGFDGGGNTINIGERYDNTRVNHVTNSTTFFALKSIPVVAGVLYHVKTILVYSGNQAAGNPQFSFLHGGIGGSITDAVGFTQVDGSNIGVWLDSGISDRTGPTLDTGGHYMLWEMTFTAPSTGNLTFSVAASVATDTWNAKALDIFTRNLS